jgi:hypothetical protein
VNGLLKWSENGLSDMASYARKLGFQYRQMLLHSSHMLDNTHNVSLWWTNLVVIRVFYKAILSAAGINSFLLMRSEGKF